MTNIINIIRTKFAKGKSTMYGKAKSLGNGRYRVWNFTVNVTKRGKKTHVDAGFKPYDIDVGMNRVALAIHRRIVKWHGELPTKEMVEKIFKGHDIYWAAVSGQGAKHAVLILDLPKKIKDVLALVEKTPKRIVRWKLLARKKKIDIRVAFPEIDTIRFVEGGMFDDYRTDGAIFVNPLYRDWTGTEIKGVMKGTIVPLENVPINEIWIPVANALKIDIREKVSGAKVETAPIEDYRNYFWIATTGKERITKKKGVQPLVSIIYDIILPMVETKASETKIAAHVFNWYRTAMLLDRVEGEMRSIVRRAFKLGVRKGGAVAVPDLKSDTVDWITIPRELARHLKVKAGDTVILFRSPLASLGAMVKVRVTISDDPAIYVHPDLWHFIELGDFDGDLAFITKDDRLMDKVFWASEVLPHFKKKVEEHEKRIEELAEKVAGRITTDDEYWKLSYDNAKAVGYLTMWWYERVINKLAEPTIENYTTQFDLFLKTVQIAIEGMKHGVSIEDYEYSKLAFRLAKTGDLNAGLAIASGILHFKDMVYVMNEVDAEYKGLSIDDPITIKVRKLFDENNMIFRHKLFLIIQTNIEKSNEKIIGRVMSEVVQNMIANMTSTAQRDAIYALKKHVRLDSRSNALFNSFDKVKIAVAEIKDTDKLVRFLEMFNIMTARDRRDMDTEVLERKFRRVLGLALLAYVPFPWNIGLADYVLTKEDHGYIEKAIVCTLRRLRNENEELYRLAKKVFVLEPDELTFELVPDNEIEYEDSIIDKLINKEE